MTTDPVLDLRAFLARVRAERRSDLVEVEREVNPRYETTAIMTKLEEKQRSPILHFRKVKGTRFPLVTNLCGSMGRLALALDCPLKLVGERYGERCERPIAPRSHEQPAPVHQNVLRGGEVDLGLLPALIYHQGDSPHPYITGAIVVARDPETGRTNLSYHRLMIAGPRHTGIFMERGKHLDAIHQKYVRRDRAMPIAAFLGVHPLVSLGSLYSGAAEVEEYDIIGGLMGAPLPLVDCLTQPGLAVPAHAEMVLEGVVPPHARIDEGPFGEFTGYGTGTIQTPLFQVSAMTFRDDCLYQDVISGHLEHLILPLPAIERRALAEARAAAAGVTRVSLVAPFTAIIALRKTNEDEPKAIIDAFLKGDIYSKHVIVVDADVEIGDPRQVLAAMALNTQATTGVHIFANEQGTPLDPSCTSADGRVAKMGIDATRKLAGSRHITRNTVPRAILDAIDINELLKKQPPG